MPSRCHLADGRIHDLVHDFAGLLRRNNTAIAVGAHAAGVGSCIAVADSLVILARFERNNLGAVADANEADFFAFQKLFNHEQRAEFLDGLLGFRERVGDDDALCRRPSPSALITTGK